MKITDIFEELDLHYKRIDDILPDILEYVPLEEKNFENKELVAKIDSFIYRFIKIQDKMGEKLFPVYLQLLQEYKHGMPLLDVLNNLERIGVIERTGQWVEYRKLRNSLTHEYPGNIDEVIDALGLAFTAFDEMKKTYKYIKEQANLRGFC